MSISNFYDRNKPIFAIAVVLALIFIGLIAYYKIKPHVETQMTQINTSDEELYKITYEDTEQGNLQENGNGVYTDYSNNGSGSEPSAIQESVDDKFGILEISYTSEGFSPRVTRAKIGQSARWTNNTDAPIYIHQRKPTYPELETDTEIKPGESFSFVMSELGIWTYEERETKHFGSIEVKPIPTE